ncbi:MAG: cell division protein FtsL [Selenomonadaceae bacterium]|nr:cell division protein FtsL [Selenomonadaceae bacterium]
MSAVRKYEEDLEIPEVPQRKERPHIVRSELRGVLNRPMRSKFRLFFVAFTILAMAVTIRSGISASRGYMLVNTYNQAQEIEQENARLKIEIAHLKSPQRIRDIAVRELGMEEASKVYYGSGR